MKIKQRIAALRMEISKLIAKPLYLEVIEELTDLRMMVTKVSQGVATKQEIIDCRQENIAIRQELSDLKRRIKSAAVCFSEENV